jgi:hypothetical protein
VLGNPNENTTKVPPETVEKVLGHVLDGLSAREAEMGPLFTGSLPAVQDEAAKAEGFADWADFLRHLRATEADADVRVARRINNRMNELLASEKNKPKDGSDPPR